MPLIYYKPDGSWTCGTCGTPHPKEETSCVCMTPKYDCPGASCPGVQRLVAFLKQAIGSITSSARL